LGGAGGGVFVDVYQIPQGSGKVRQTDRWADIVASGGVCLVPTVLNSIFSLDLWNLLSVFLSGRKYMEVDTVRNSIKKEMDQDQEQRRGNRRDRKQEVEMVTGKGRGGKKQGKLRKPHTILKRDLLLPRHSEPVQESLHQERYHHLIFRVLLVLY
jgi:hypothetical protein